MDQRIDARIAALEAELLELKAAVATDSEVAAPTSDRRGMIKLVAAGAVGAVTGAALFNARPAAAADGSSIVQGQTNSGTVATVVNASTDSALIANGDGGYGIVADGGIANALFSGSGPDPLGGGSGIGELYVDAAGDWWAGVVDAATGGTWRKLAGPGTAGQLHVLPSPVRVYDSRPGQAPTDVLPKAPTVGNTPRQIDTTANGSGVPGTANAVLINLTITGPQAPGFATAWPSGAWPGTSNINFATGQDVAATTVVGCGPGATILIQSNTVTNFLIDVIGYYQ